MRSATKVCSEPPTGNVRDTLLNLFSPSTNDGGLGLIRGLMQRWQADKFPHEREYSRLLFCLVFFHSLMVARSHYGPMGGGSVASQVAPSDLRMAISLLKSLSGGADSSGHLTVVALREVVDRCCYGAAAANNEAKSRVSAMLKACLSPKVLTTNRYKFSAVPDYYVPNKTHHKDYVEFIKVKRIICTISCISIP